MGIKLSERYVQDMIQSRYGVLLHKIDEDGGKKGKSPDFEFIKANERVFVCELKSFEDVKPCEKDGWSITYHPDGSEEASKASNAPNRISKKIREAYKQLSKYSEPKVLIFLDYSGTDYRDLEEVYRGYSIIEFGNIRIKNTYARRASEGLIKDKKSKIDLYIWIDASRLTPDFQDNQITFLTVSETGRRIAVEHFGISIDTT